MLIRDSVINTNVNWVIQSEICRHKNCGKVLEAFNPIFIQEPPLHSAIIKFIVYMWVRVGLLCNFIPELFRFRFSFFLRTYETDPHPNLITYFQVLFRTEIFGSTPTRLPFSTADADRKKKQMNWTAIAGRGNGFNNILTQLPALLRQLIRNFGPDSFPTPSM